MRSDAELETLKDIRENILLAQDFIKGSTQEAFLGDRKTQYAVVRCLEIISEAARRLSVELRERHPELPWRAIMGAGNIYRHDYDNVAPDFVWRTVRISLDLLLAVVKSEISGDWTDLTRTAHSPPCSGGLPR